MGTTIFDKKCKEINKKNWQRLDKDIDWFLSEIMTIKESRNHMAQRHTWPHRTKSGSLKNYLHLMIIFM